MYLVDDGTKRIEISKDVHTQNENYDYARIKEAEARARIEEQKIKRQIDEKRIEAILCIPAMLFVLAFFYMLFSVGSSGIKEKEAIMSSAAAANIEMITTLHSSKDYVDEDYHLVEKDLEERGFTNIVVTVEKSNTNLGTVSSVTIGGEQFQSGESFPADAEVVIKYRAEKLFN